MSFPQAGGKGGVAIQGPPGLAPPPGLEASGPELYGGKGSAAGGAAFPAPHSADGNMTFVGSQQGPCSSGSSAPRLGMMQGPNAPSPGGGRSSAAAAMAALQKFAAAERESAVSGTDQAMGFEEHLLNRISAEEAAKQAALRLQSSPLAKNAAESSPARSKEAGPRYTGIIKAFSTVQGFGFIQSKEMTNLYGCDAFLNQAVEGGIVIGGTVSFSVEMNKAGKPQARNVVLEDSTPKPVEPAKPKGGNLNYSGYPMGGPMSNHMGHMGMGNPKQAKDLAGKLFKGRVKSFNPNRGFGFMLCSDLQSILGGRDVYVGVNQVPNGVLPVGKEYEFRLSIDRQGQPQAKELRPLS